MSAWGTGCSTILVVALACCQLAPPATAAPVSPTRSTKPSGYAIGDARCGGAALSFPRVRIGLRQGYCAGIVASEEDGLVFPRSIVQVPDTGLFVVADMGGWSPGRGRLLLLDPAAPRGNRLKVLISGLDFPHGLAVGIDRRIYASTDTSIFRFDPLAAQPKATVQTILKGLPGRRVTLSDGSTVAEATHPLKPFVFDKTGRMYVNIGAPTDSCTSKPCAAGEGPVPLASIWAFTPPASGVFPALRPGDANPAREVFGRGLRNSMALAVHPQFPAAGFPILQAENARDLPDPAEPNEELNVLESGRHYGWPYCYDLETVSPEYKAFLQTNTRYRQLCTNTTLYRQPHSLLPPHSAPLGMLYYEADKFPELKGKLVVGLHGYRPTGSRIIFYEVDAKGLPIISPPPVRYNVSCASEPTQVFRTEQQAQVPAAPFSELISEWHRVNGVRPQGAPVGITVASDGAIWIVEDKNQSILRIDVDPAAAPFDHLPCDARSEKQIKELIDFVAGSADNSRRLSQVRTRLVEQHCVGCHSDFGLSAALTGAARDRAVLEFILRQDGWLYPGDPDSGRLHRRVWAMGAEKPMPANARELIATDARYREVLQTLDQLIRTMVPGERRRLKAGHAVARPVLDRASHICGSIPDQTMLVVIDRTPAGKPGYSRIYRPADQYLNGECTDEQGYYVAAQYLGAP
jgi:glucose/arabinose dehydrogenase